MLMGMWSWLVAVMRDGRERRRARMMVVAIVRWVSVKLTI